MKADLSPAVFEALMYWPGVVHAEKPTPADLEVLPPLFNELLDEWPCWDRAWRVTEVQPAYPREVARNNTSSFTEVTVPGTVSHETGDTLPLSARVRFTRDQLIRFQAKVGDVVLGPAATPAGAPEPHPFGRVLDRLMDLRGISNKEMSYRTYRARSTINGLRHGSLNPHRQLVAEVAAALGMIEEDLLAISGVAWSHPSGDTNDQKNLDPIRGS